MDFFRDHGLSLFPFSFFSDCILPRFTVLFQSYCSSAKVFGRTLVQEFHIFYSHTKLDLLFSIFRISGLFWRQLCYETESLFFVTDVDLSIFTHIFLQSSASLYYIILAVPTRKCSGEHSCTSFTFPIQNHTEWYLPFSVGEITLALAEALAINN